MEFGIVKKMIDRIIFIIIRIFPLDKLIAKMQMFRHAKVCRSQVSSEYDVFFYKDAIVSNQQNDKSKIIIGKNTHISGTILVFGYGGKINIGNNCYVGDHSRIWSGEEIVIGDDVLISHNVNIMDNNGHELDYELRAEGFVNSFIHGTQYLQGRISTKKIIIEDNVWIGFNSIILKGVKIGQGAIVAAGSLVTKDVPSFTLVGGNPAVVLKDLH